MNKSEEQSINELKNKSQAWARILLRYIDKLQKENEELKEQTSLLGIQEMLDKFYERKDKIEKYYISKDKIRKIVEKSYNDIEYFYRDIIKDLEELLKEE